MDSRNPFIYRVGSPTNVIGRPPRFYGGSEIANSGSQFASVYAVRKEDAQAIRDAAGTAAGFRGVVWSRRLWIDFDSYEAADKAEETLRQLGLDHVVYDTGGRGRHIGILRAAEPSHTLPLQDKQWVRANIEGADLGIYWHLHLIRLPGAIHERTGRKKTKLREFKGTELVLPKLADHNDPAMDIIGEHQASRVARPSIFRCWEVTSNLTPTSGGSRHRQLVNLSLALCKDAKVSFEEALWVVREVNRGFDEPKEDVELERMVRWAYESGGSQ